MSGNSILEEKWEPCLGLYTKFLVQMTIKNWFWKICNISGFWKHTEYLSGWLRGDTVGCPQIPHRWNQLRWSCDRRLGSAAFEHVHRRLFLWRRHRNTIFQVCSSSYFFSYSDLSICHLLYASWLWDELFRNWRWNSLQPTIWLLNLVEWPTYRRVTNDWTYLLIQWLVSFFSVQCQWLL